MFKIFENYVKVIDKKNPKIPQNENPQKNDWIHENIYFVPFEEKKILVTIKKRLNGLFWEFSGEGLLGKIVVMEGKVFRDKLECVNDTAERVLSKVNGF